MSETLVHSSLYLGLDVQADISSYTLLTSDRAEKPINGRVNKLSATCLVRYNHAMRYKITVHFSGTASLDLDAASPEAARLAAAELTLADLARDGHSQVHELKIAAREITPQSALTGEEEAEDGPARRPARPSGWYRPL